MSEQYPPDATLLALTQDSDTGVEYIETGKAPYYLEFRKMLYRLLLATKRANDLRVYDDGGLNIGVKAGSYIFGSQIKTFSGTTARACTNNATNYIWLDQNNTLQIGTNGWPAGVHDCIRLATVVTSAGDITSITDARGPYIISTLGELNECIPKVDIDVGAESGNQISVAVQMQDAGGADLSRRFLLHCWLGDSEYGSECSSAPDGGVSVSAGTTLQTITTGKHWTIITDSAGKVQLDITESTAKTFYLMVEFDGRIYVSSAITFA